MKLMEAKTRAKTIKFKSMPLHSNLNSTIQSYFFVCSLRNCFSFFQTCPMNVVTEGNHETLLFNYGTELNSYLHLCHVRALLSCQGWKFVLIFQFQIGSSYYHGNKPTSVLFKSRFFFLDQRVCFHIFFLRELFRECLFNVAEQTR